MSERDGLKPLAELLQPDIRHRYFVRTNAATGEQRSNTLEDHYTDIERYSLHDKVPDNIATQFDVARNLYVYAWFEYRFFNVAEAQVLTVLELALKERIGDKEIKRYIKQRNKDYREQTGKKSSPVRQGMKTLMEYCRDHQLVHNEGFTQWQHHATRQAYYQTEQAQNEWAIAEMQRTGKTEIELPDIEMETLPPDPNYDHVQHLIDYTNKIRNSYAHGSSSLYNPTPYSFEMVSEFINQLYSNHSSSQNDHSTTLENSC